MGIFDKIKDTAREAGGAAEKYAKKAQTALGESRERKAAKTKAESRPPYIPPLVDLRSTIPQGVEDDSAWKKITGIGRTFFIGGKPLVIPENLDAFNLYRAVFFDLAGKYADKAEREYQEKVHDYASFMENFPRIYDENLYPLLKKAMEALVAEGVWSVTFDSFAARHKENCGTAIKFYEIIAKTTAECIEASRQGAAIAGETFKGFMRKFTPHVSRLGDFLGVSDDFVNEAVEAGITIDIAQQEVLYNRLKDLPWFSAILFDYLMVTQSLAIVMCENGCDIWIPDSAKIRRAENIFENLSNPSFPEDKVADALIQIMEANPYNEDYCKLMISKFGETDETLKIRDYFVFFPEPKIETKEEQ